MSSYSQADINDLFSMFHDFEIIGLGFKDKQLIMTTRIPWGFLWDDDDYRIKLILEGCDYITCTYSEYTDSTGTETVEKVTDDCIIIEKLQLWVQSSLFYGPTQYELFCDSRATRLEAQLRFTTDNFQIFDKYDSHMGLDKMKDLGTQWWDSFKNTS